MKIQIIHYFDVWGNQEEGYEVNDLCTHSTIERESFPYEKKENLEVLKETDLIKESVTEDMIEIECDGDNWVEINEASNGRPFCRIVEAI